MAPRLKILIPLGPTKEPTYTILFSQKSRQIPNGDERNYLHCSSRKASKRKRFEEEEVDGGVILKCILRFSSQQYTVGFRKM
jgi:hypothetical protein